MDDENTMHAAGSCQVALCGKPTLELMQRTVARFSDRRSVNKMLRSARMAAIMGRTAAMLGGRERQQRAVCDEMVLAIANAPVTTPYACRFVPPPAYVIYSSGRFYLELEYDNGQNRNQRGCTKIPSCYG